ncbi:MotA/TolQ/ExbB proton channel family protein [Gemmatimonas sp.]|jgi:biopolymer transport protein TolQ|uniref:MotA/TolQ/ExbB proton channel family protein n=1 Tax=Gemmatimonas sp. TaxID=1962908 RepID=UPI0037C071E7
MNGMAALFLLQLSTQDGSTASRSIVALIMGSDPVTKAVLGLLIVLSLLSWAIMFSKWRTFSSVESSGARFVAEFERARGIDDAMLMAQRANPSPFTVVFLRAVQFLNDTKPALGATPERTARLSGSQVEALRLVLDSQSGREREALGRFIPWLATVGSVSPLIGLFGTVLGVIEAFEGIATKGSGNIGAVAPGIATALIATAAALAVAIPAAFAYNVFAARLNRFDNELEGFGSELVALMVREGRI